MGQLNSTTLHTAVPKRQDSALTKDLTDNGAMHTVTETHETRHTAGTRDAALLSLRFSIHSQVQGTQ